MRGGMPQEVMFILRPRDFWWIAAWVLSYATAKAGLAALKSRLVDDREAQDGDRSTFGGAN